MFRLSYEPLRLGVRRGGRVLCPGLSGLCLPEHPPATHRLPAPAGEPNHRKAPLHSPTVASPENIPQIKESLLAAHACSGDTSNFERVFPALDHTLIPKRDLFSNICKFAKTLKLRCHLPLSHSTPCRLFQITMFVRWHGNVTPCCYCANRSRGNLLTDGPTKVLNQRGQFRKSMKNDPVCSRCRT